MSDTFAFEAWRTGEAHLIDRLSVTPFEAVHPVEAYSLRITEHTSQKTIAYSGDTGWTDQLVECARDADVFLCSGPAQEAAMIGLAAAREEFDGPIEIGHQGQVIEF